MVINGTDSGVITESHMMIYPNFLSNFMAQNPSKPKMYLGRFRSESDLTVCIPCTRPFYVGQAISQAMSGIAKPRYCYVLLMGDAANYKEALENEYRWYVNNGTIVFFTHDKVVSPLRARLMLAYKVVTKDLSFLDDDDIVDKAYFAYLLRSQATFVGGIPYSNRELYSQLFGYLPAAQMYGIFDKEYFLNNKDLMYLRNMVAYEDVTFWYTLLDGHYSLEVNPNAIYHYNIGIQSMTTSGRDSRDDYERCMKYLSSRNYHIFNGISRYSLKEFMINGFKQPLALTTLIRLPSRKLDSNEIGFLFEFFKVNRCLSRVYFLSEDGRYIVNIDDYIK